MPDLGWQRYINDQELMHEGGGQMEGKAEITITCGMCGEKQPPFHLGHHQLLAWRQGVHIQDILPDEPPARRELLISATCGPCFDKLFPPEED